jgi:transcriptional regulator with XRE-family HTH domain
MKLKKSELVMLIGSNIREIRVKKGFTIAQLAFEAGIESKQLFRIELGQINTSLFQIYRITKAMNIEMYEVFLFSDKYLLL